MSEPTADDPFSMFAAELSHNLPLITRLLAEHPGEGFCTGCRLPSPQRAVQAPCGVRNVAVLALRLRAADKAGEDETGSPQTRPRP